MPQSETMKHLAKLSDKDLALEIDDCKDHVMVEFSR
jgi:hypothetical protein